MRFAERSQSQAGKRSEHGIESRPRAFIGTDRACTRMRSGLGTANEDHATHQRLNALRLSFTCPITVPFRSLQGLRELPASCKFLKHLIIKGRWFKSTPGNHLPASRYPLAPIGYRIRHRSRHRRIVIAFNPVTEEFYAEWNSGRRHH